MSEQPQKVTLSPEQDASNKEPCELCGNAATHLGFAAVGVQPLTPDGEIDETQPERYWQQLNDSGTYLCDDCVEIFINS